MSTATGVVIQLSRIKADSEKKMKLKAFHKKTEDGDPLSFNDFAWEVLYQWLNAETSVAYAATIKVGKSKGKIWRSQWNCEIVCIEINSRKIQQPQRNILSDLFYWPHY